MSTAQEAPALIQYACERCKTRFVLPPSRRRLGLFGRLHATGMAIGRSIKNREGIKATYDGARRQLLAKLDDDAYQAFVQSFKFCHECRQFVCSECWSSSRRTCLGCFAKAAGTVVKPRPPFAPIGPDIPRPLPAAAPKGGRRLRTNASLLLLAAAIVMLAAEMLVILPNMNHGGGNPNDQPTDVAAVTTASPTVTSSPTDYATPTIDATPVPMPTDSPTSSPSPSPSPTPSPTASPSPTSTPTPTPTRAPTRAPTAKPKATPKPYPTSVSISCAGYTGYVKCTWVRSSLYNNSYSSFQWKMDGTEYNGLSVPSATMIPGDTSTHGFTLTVTFSNGRTYTSAPKFVAAT